MNIEARIGCVDAGLTKQGISGIQRLGDGQTEKVYGHVGFSNGTAGKLILDGTNSSVLGQVGFTDDNTQIGYLNDEVTGLSVYAAQSGENLSVHMTAAGGSAFLLEDMTPLTITNTRREFSGIINTTFEPKDQLEIRQLRTQLKEQLIAMTQRLLKEMQLAPNSGEQHDLNLVLEGHTNCAMEAYNTTSGEGYNGDLLAEAVVERAHAIRSAEAFKELALKALGLNMANIQDLRAKFILNREKTGDEPIGKDPMLFEMAIPI